MIAVLLSYCSLFLGVDIELFWSICDVMGSKSWEGEESGLLF
jgi:hypothetical protein